MREHERKLRVAGEIPPADKLVTVPPSIDSLVKDHGAIESALDRLARTIHSGQVDAVIIREIADLIRHHYRREEPFLDSLREHEPDLSEKLEEQHAEALEIAARLLEALATGGAADTIYLARRLLAITQHNIIEEERDVFPLARRLFEGPNYSSS